jgi:hypothetical protein
MTEVTRERLEAALCEAIECVGEFVDVHGNEWHDGTPLSEKYESWKAALSASIAEPPLDVRIAKEAIERLRTTEDPWRDDVMLVCNLAARAVAEKAPAPRDAEELCECGQPKNSIRHSFSAASSVDAHKFNPVSKKEK